jgi:dTDP-4-dehydrorhamnose 3,5-epimerase
MLDFKECSLPGLRVFVPAVQKDERGSFVKIFHESFFRSSGLQTVFREIYYSTSVHGVLRGLHFQLPPEDHEKLVYCTAGHILDAVVDLRLDSPTYGHHEVIELSADLANCVYIPRGFTRILCPL